MLKFSILLSSLLLCSVAWAEVSIETPESGAEVPIPFLIEGHAEPGQALNLVADGHVVLVFRADTSGQFSVPVDIAGTRFAVASADGSDLATIDVRVAGTAPTRTVRREDAAVDAVPQPESTPETTPAPPAVEAATEEQPVEYLAVPAAVDPNTVVYRTAPVAEARPWNPTGAAVTQLTVGSLAGLSGGLLGGIFGYTVLEPAFDSASYPLPGAATIVPLSVGFLAATGFSVWGIGQAFGGDSPWWASMLGGLAGTALAVVFPPAALILTPVGATAGYHIARRK